MTQATVALSTRPPKRSNATSVILSEILSSDPRHPFGDPIKHICDRETAGDYKRIPCDTDTTSVGLTVLRRDKTIAFPIMDEILVDLVNTDGIILVSGHPSLPSVRQHNLKITRHILTVDARGLIPVSECSHSVLYSRARKRGPTASFLVPRRPLHRAYLDGTKYFNAPDSLFFLITRLLACSEDTELHGMLQPLLKDRVQERIGAEGDAPMLAGYAYLGMQFRRNQERG